jgi:hypothetical protein
MGTVWKNCQKNALSNLEIAAVTVYVVNQAISAWSALSICLQQKILNDQANIA